MKTRLLPARFRAPSRRSLGVALGSAAAGASWMALVASTTVGMAELQRVRAEVSVGGHELSGSSPEEYRLVVHSYAADTLVDGVPAEHARPLASTQRSVTAAELARGIAVDVVGVGAEDGTSRVVVAWVEPGAPNLEFDGRRARPSRDAYVGIARTEGERRAARLVLSRRSA